MRRDAYEIAENDRLKKDIRQLEAAARQSKQWADRAERTKIGKKKDADKYDSMGGRAYIGEQSRRLQQRRKNLERRQEAAIDDKNALEPLNYIDIQSRMQIEELLLSTNSTVIFVEHDRAFSNRVATKQILLPS